MIYNFYLFMILFSIISAIKIFLKKDILNCCHIFEEIIISSFLIFTITMFSYFVIMKQNMKSFWKRLLSNEDNFFWKILLFEVVFISGIMIGSYILQKEEWLQTKYVVFIRANIFWSFLMAKTICVAGASGLVGSSIVKEALFRGYNVHGTLRDATAKEKVHYLNLLKAYLNFINSFFHLL